MVPWRAVLAVAARPSLWLEAARAAGAVSPRGPAAIDRRYLAWRIMTAYGSSDAAIDPGDLTAYLRWRKKQRS